MVAAAEAARRGETLHLVHAWTEPALYDRAFLLDEEFLRSLETEHRRILDAAGLIASTSGFEGGSRRIWSAATRSGPSSRSGRR